jgi:DnaK suppressor protein
VDSQTARQRLVEMLDELDRSAETLRRERPAGESDELSNLDQHPADAATYLSDNDRDDALREVVDERRQQITAALRRIDAGSYGRCVDCGAELPEERLDARPEAERCVHCQSKLEAAR